MTNDRPAWTCPIDAETFRWLLRRIVAIKYQSRLISADRSEEWLELSTETETRIFPYDFLNREDRFFEFDARFGGLIRLTYKGEQARKQLEARDKWDKENEKDLADYHRLKAKFEG